MLYDRLENHLVIEDPTDSLHLVLSLMCSEEDLDEETLDRLTGEVTLTDGKGTIDGWTNYYMQMEHYPIRLSSESTQLVLAALGVNEGDIPDAPIDI